MPTECLFRDDSYLREVSATVIGLTGVNIALDRTVFYAASGGQPGDHDPVNEVETVVETPGGTTVSEQPAQHASQVDRSGEGAPGDISGYSSVVEDPSQSEADVSHLSGRDKK